MRCMRCSHMRIAPHSAGGGRHSYFQRSPGRPQAVPCRRTLHAYTPATRTPAVPRSQRARTLLNIWSTDTATFLSSHKKLSV